MSSDDKGDEYRSKSLELVERLQKQAYVLLKKYRTLRQTKLYRYLKKTKPVLNPLNETNILAMDKHYSIFYQLWRTIHHVIAPKVIEEEANIITVVGLTFTGITVPAATILGANHQATFPNELTAG